MTSSMTLNDTKLYNDIIIASLKSESSCKLINIIPGSRLLISSLPGSVSRTHVDIKRREPGILYVFACVCMCCLCTLGIYGP